jgi:hypothetical protein
MDAQSRQTLLEVLDLERRNLVRDGDVVETLPHVTRMSPVRGSFHTIVYSRLDERNVDAVITREVEHYRRLGAPVEWKVYSHDRPPNLLDRLRRHGFNVGPCEAVLVLDLNDAPPWVQGPDAAEVVRVERLDHVELFKAAAEEIFGKDYGFTAGQLADAIRAGSTQHVGYVAFCGGAPAAIGRLYTHPHSAFGGLYGGGTRPGFRGRGAYRSLVAARARDARSAGARYLIVDALPTSRPILQRLGFEHVADTWPCEWKPPDHS